MGCGASSAAGPSVKEHPKVALAQSFHIDASVKGSASLQNKQEALNFVDANRQGVAQGKAGLSAGKHMLKIEGDNGQVKEYKPLRRGSYSSNATGTNTGGAGQNGQALDEKATADAKATVDEYASRPLNKFVLSHLKDVMFLAHLEDPLLERLARMFDLIKYDTGDFVISQGQKGTHLYFVQSGKVSAWSADEPGKIFVTYGSGQIFGELTYLYPSKKTFLNITADEPSELYRVEHEKLRKAIASWEIVRMKKYADLLGACDIFRNVGRDNLMKLVELMSVVEHAYGDELATYGKSLPEHIEPESVIWVVEEGGLEISVPVDGQLTVIETLNAGDYFPMYLVDDAEALTWTASVATCAPSKIIVIERTAVERTDPDLWSRCKAQPNTISIVQRFAARVEQLASDGRSLGFNLKTRPRAKWNDSRSVSAGPSAEAAGSRGGVAGTNSDINQPLGISPALLAALSTGPGGGGGSARSSGVSSGVGGGAANSKRAAAAAEGMIAEDPAGEERASESANDASTSAAGIGGELSDSAAPPADPAGDARREAAAAAAAAVLLASDSAALADEEVERLMGDVLASQEGRDGADSSHPDPGP